MAQPVTAFGQNFTIPDSSQTSAGFHLGRFLKALAQGAGTVLALTANRTLTGASNSPQVVADAGSTLLNATTTNYTATLPVAAPGAAAGVQYVAVQQSTGTVTFTAPTGKLAGAGNATKTSVTTGGAGTSVTVQCVDGTNWIVIASTGTPVYTA